MQVLKSLFSSAIFAVLLVAPFAASAEAATTVSSGDLIRGQSFSAVYYMGADGFRYVFPNDKTYFTWYTDFSTVKFITDAELAKIQIGGNVTYKPGVKMIKINTDPKVYYVAEGGELSSIKDEATATMMYGSTWNKMIDDVPDGFFTNYTLTGDEIGPSESDIVLTKYTGTINDDKGLTAPAIVSVKDSGYAPLDVTIDAGESVRFTNNGSSNHTATADDLSWGSGTLKPGESFIRTFKKEGTYTFFDSYDSANTGAIFVE